MNQYYSTLKIALIQHVMYVRNIYENNENQDLIDFYHSFARRSSAASSNSTGQF
jgi:hypothetical protein